jgi:hypothetical protein
MIERNEGASRNISEEQKAEVQVKGMDRRTFLKRAVLFTLMGGGAGPFINACTNLPEGEPTAQPEKTPTSTPEPEETEVFKPTETAQPTIEKETAQPTIEAGGGNLPEWFNEEEVQSSINEQKQLIEGYVQESEAFAAEPGQESGLAWDYYWNDETKQVKLAVQVKPGHGYPDRTEFTFTESGEPVQMSPEQGESLDFDWERNTFVKKNTESGQVTHFLNEENQWQEVQPDQEGVENEAELEPLIEYDKKLDLDQEIRGMPFKVSVALHPSLINDEDYPVKDIEINEGVDFVSPDDGQTYTPKELVAELALRAHWEGYKEDHGEISMEEYEELVRQGKGQYTVMASVNSPEYESIEEKHELREVTVDPLERIIIVVSDRSAPMVSETSHSGVWIVKEDDSILMEHTFIKKYRKKRYSKRNSMNFGLSRQLRMTMGILSYNEEYQSNTTGQIGGYVYSPDSLTFYTHPQTEAKNGILKAVY